MPSIGRMLIGTKLARRLLRPGRPMMAGARGNLRPRIAAHVIAAVACLLVVSAAERGHHRPRGDDARHRRAGPGLSAIGRR